MENEALIRLTARVVAAYVGHNSVATSDVPRLIASVHGALTGLGSAPVEEARKPAVAIGASVKPGYLVCLEDGKRLKMLRRYLARQHGMTPEQYRARWGLPASYPMVAPDYSKHRRQLAHQHGLGRKHG